MTEEVTLVVGCFIRILDSPNTIGIEMYNLDDKYNFQDVSDAAHHFLTVKQGFDTDTFIITRLEGYAGAIVEFVNEGIVMAKLIDYIE